MSSPYYKFYEMMWFPAPFQKELFAFFSNEEEKKLPWWEPLALSRWKLSTKGLRVQSFLESYWYIWKYVPFVEMVFVAWDSTFNWNEDHYPIWLWVVCSRWRFRWWYLFTRLCVSWISLYSRAHWSTWCSLLYVLEEWDLSLLHMKRSEYDIWSIYSLAHFSLWYKKYEQISYSLYEENLWLKEYLPNHPLDFVIWLSQNLILGKKEFIITVESILWRTIFNVWTYVIRAWSVLCMYIHNVFSKKTFHVFHNAIFWVHEKNKKIMLQRKVLRWWWVDSS